MINGMAGTRRFRSVLLLCALLWSIPLGVGSTAGPKPYADLRSRPYEFPGPREPGEADVPEVRIGVFAPIRGPQAAAGRSLRRGIELAVAEANAQGGYRGKPFRLILRPADRLWGSAREVVQLVYADRVWAVIGSVGGQSTHIAEQIITKAHVPLIGPASTDDSLTQINIPWMFRCMPGDEQIARTLADHLFREKGYRRVAQVVADEYDQRLRATELEKVARQLGTPLVASLQYPPNAQDFAPQRRMLQHAEAQAVVIWGKPKDSARLIQALREGGMRLPIYGGPDLASAQFLKHAGADAEGVTVVALADLGRNDPELQDFQRRFQERYGEDPDVIAAYAYDSMRLVIQAVRRGGLNRVRIRDALAQVRTFQGVTGTIRFDGTGSNVNPPILLTVRGGQFVRRTLGEGKDTL